MSQKKWSVEKDLSDIRKDEEAWNQLGTDLTDCDTNKMTVKINTF